MLAGKGITMQAVEQTAAAVEAGIQPHARLQVQARVGPHAILAVIVGVSFLARALAGLVHVAPYYFQDEYLYVALARGIAKHGTPVIQGAQVSFPALLEPLTTAPFWLLAGRETALHLTQTLHGLEMSLGAVPVYLIARRLGLPDGRSLVCGAVAVISPELFWSSFFLADAISYPLALAAVLAAVKALDEPTRRSQFLFLTAAALAVLARTQYAVLPIAYLLAATVLERGSMRRVLRRHSVVTTAGALAAIFGVLLAARGGLGPYGAWLHPAVNPVAFATSAGLDVTAIALASGFVLLPGALLGLDLALSKPRGRAELGFASFSLFTACALGAFASLGTLARVQERYLIVLVPLVAIFFLLWVERGAPRPRLAGMLAVGLTAVALALRLPARAATHSATLWAMERFSAWLHVRNVGYLLIAILGLLGAVVSLLPRGRRPAALLTVAAASMLALSAGAFAFDLANAHAVRQRSLPETTNWIDRSGVIDVALLQTAGAARDPSLEQVFWNESVGRVLEMPGAAQVDSFATSKVRIGPDGRLLAGGKTLRQPLLVPRHGSLLRLDGAELVRRTPLFDLWRPRGEARLSWLAVGVGPDGLLSRHATITIWPHDRPGMHSELRLSFELTRHAASTRSVRVHTGSLTQRATVAPGGRRLVVTPLGQHRSTVSVEVSGGGLRLRTPRVVAGAAGDN